MTLRRPVAVLAALTAAFALLAGAPQGQVTVRVVSRPTTTVTGA